jgi:DNA-binding PadR family transcriptional regulator
MLLLLAEEPVHGYELMGRMSAFGIDPEGTDPSVLYRMLRQMEIEGLTSSRLDPSGSGPARKVYYPTEAGREVLEMWAAKLQQTASSLSRFAERFGKLSIAVKQP